MMDSGQTPAPPRSDFGRPGGIAAKALQRPARSHCVANGIGGPAAKAPPCEARPSKVRALIEVRRVWHSQEITNRRP